MAPCNTQSTPFTPPFRKIPSYHYLTTREEESPAESHTVILVVIFVVVVLVFLFICIMGFAPWRKIKRAQYGRVDQEEEHELQEDADQDWPLVVDTHPVSPPRPRLEEQIRKLWESSRGKQRSPKQAANTRDSMDLADFDDVDLATPWKKDEAYDENTNYKDDVEDKERKWVKQPVKGQGANHKSSDDNASNKSTNTKKLA
ncbi:uncharacterized protein NECHADRAFT_83394 [Fusarium vanettenii 77-13-4]|uniref:Uncharacterized protein n=1 Tax=Fusarium vanettenii (strain ATCC MYA-4622 / CBS 123669 / FGSC 9596 / NRRL 45880 / 77-13-4) TaxID=660122 RepID=C7Z3W7_FUSV7|nr:uncharacterized protein NECHADRAFT_83394 [Fusarium vanettenii 77-13-4]EEU41214.1 predicted protein [Fusarium vanettenii 77-13-4]